MPDLADPTIAAFQSQFPAQLEDPQLAAFWASDPSVLDENAPIPPGASRSRRRLLEAGVAIGAAFLVVRKLIADRLPEEPPPDLRTASHAAFEHHAPIWLRFAVPAIAEAYRLGKMEGLTAAEINELATHYAAGLGEYLDETSGDALQDGFYTQLNAKWNERVAWQRARAAYGLDKRQMAAYVQSVMRGSEAGRAEPVPLLARAFIDRMLAHRAQTLGDNEAWRAARSGEGLTWAILQDRGVLPPTATKEWVISPSETTCGVCYALNGQQVGLKEAFELEGARYYAPGAHPGCRCRMRLTVPIEKAYNPNEPRDWRGRWATHQDARPVRTLVRPEPEAEAEPEVKPEAKPQVKPATQPQSVFATQPQSVFRPSVFGTQSAYSRTSAYAPTTVFTPEAIKAAQEAQQALEARVLQSAKTGSKRLVHIHLWKKPPIPPPEGGNSGDVYAVSFDDYGHLFGKEGIKNPEELHLHPFSDLQSHVPIKPVVYDPERAVGRNLDDLSDSEWKSIVDMALEIRKVLFDTEEDRYLKVLKRLEDDEHALSVIGKRAGYRLPQEPKAREDIVRGIYDGIQTQILDMNRAKGAPIDTSLAEAYADYITFVAPELVEPEGRKLQYYLESHSQFSNYPMRDSRPVSLLILKGLTPFDQEVGHLSGIYAYDGTSYKSMIGTYGHRAPNGVIGIQENYFAPVADVENPFPDYNFPDPGDMTLEDKWAADVLEDEELEEEDDW